MAIWLDYRCKTALFTKFDFEKGQFLYVLETNLCQRIIIFIRENNPWFEGFGFFEF